MGEYIEEIGSIFPESSPTKIKSEAEILREQNIKEREAFFASLLIDPEFAEAVEAINSAYKSKTAKTPNSVSKVKPKRYGQSRDESVKFFVKIPSEPRKSSRIRNIPPEYKDYDLIDETDSTIRKKFHSDNDDFEDIDEVVFVPRTKRRSGKKLLGKHIFIPVEEVTEQMLRNVAKRVSDKEWSEKGSSCHQCRQKTLDQKTSCRNEQCFGVRGQFCGVCLQNRYGEDALIALKNPNWHCPVCRGICNCSFCRAKEGKRPTGILTPLAQKYGHKSVKDFLESLRGEGDYSDERKDPKKLLGFSKDLQFAQMGAGKQYKFDIWCDTKKLIECTKELERKLMYFSSKESLLLKGFKNNFMKYDNGETHLKCEVCDYKNDVSC